MMGKGQEEVMFHGQLYSCRLERKGGMEAGRLTEVFQEGDVDLLITGNARAACPGFGWDRWESVAVSLHV